MASLVVSEHESAATTASKIESHIRDLMSFVIILAALAFLMFAAYRGYSIILFAPIAATRSTMTA